MLAGMNAVKGVQFVRLFNNLRAGAVEVLVFG